MARRSIGYHPAARLEADDAFSWYWDRSLSAADQFQKELEKAQATIQASPELWAEYMHGTRRYLLKQFPFVIVYRVTATRIEIIAIAHGQREPGYWIDRLRSAE
jgi:toxin ParE1/3/4